jgi:outer membrane protein assembly factor BamE (lipoprotein component of BamABCDE complex)
VTNRRTAADLVVVDLKGVSMQINKAYLLFSFLFLVSIFACASTLQKSSQLRQVSLGMSKDEIIGALGEPAVARGAIRNKFNQVIEVWEYTLALPSKDSAGQIVGKSVLTFITLGMGAATFQPEKKNYWLYFLDNKLVQWGEAGDWRKEPERIYDFNFNPSPLLTK